MRESQAKESEENQLCHNTTISMYKLNEDLINPNKSIGKLTVHDHQLQNEMESDLMEPNENFQIFLHQHVHSFDP